VTGTRENILVCLNQAGEILIIKTKMNCYCCSGREFEDCCEPFIAGTAKPSTALLLMRSRYTAYATGAVEYILRTTHPSVRKFHDAASIEQWAKSSLWQRLEIIATTGGNSSAKHGTVEFKAYFLDANRQPQIHHENSSFQKELGKWFFVDGKVL
jgi:SEC-C motif-containing protein